MSLVVRQMKRRWTRQSQHPVAAEAFSRLFPGSPPRLASDSCRVGHSAESLVDCHSNTPWRVLRSWGCLRKTIKPWYHRNHAGTNELSSRLPQGRSECHTEHQEGPASG